MLLISDKVQHISSAVRLQQFQFCNDTGKSSVMSFVIFVIRNCDFHLGFFVKLFSIQDVVENTYISGANMIHKTIPLNQIFV